VFHQCSNLVTRYADRDNQLVVEVRPAVQPKDELQVDEAALAAVTRKKKKHAGQGSGAAGQKAGGTVFRRESLAHGLIGAHNIKGRSTVRPTTSISVKLIVFSLAQICVT
jgi:hypothetical protein